MRLPKPCIRRIRHPIPTSVSDVNRQVVSKIGTRPDPRKVADSINTSQPNNTHEVQSFQTTHSCVYIPHFTTLTAPLRELTKMDCSYECTQIHQHTFE